MERLEFLSGKYKDAERIVPGAVQTFQATEATTGRAVFVHRVPASGAEGQNPVIRLLRTALLRSAEVRKRVVEVTDEDEFCYVVTDNAEQCLLLREWLQFELDQTSAGGDSEKRQTNMDAAAGNTKAPAAPASEPPLEEKKAPGEFTRLFQMPGQPAAPAAPPVPAAKGGETGEFTRFFRTDLRGEPKADVPRRPDRPPSSEGLRPQRSGAVQRPANAPVPPLPQRAFDSGEFRRTGIESNRSSESGEIKRQAPGEFTRLFSAPQGGALPPQSSKPPLPSAGGLPDPGEPAPGEYTRLFGNASNTPPFTPSPATPLQTTGKYDVAFPTGTPAMSGELPRGPSEYTRVIGRNELRAAGLAPESQVPASQPPAAPAPTAAAPTPDKPAAANKRLTIFLIVIALLAAGLVIAVILLAKR
jgi:hypothetical protein